jgi:hypothetical protein
MILRHSHNHSVPPSIATLSPAETQRGFAPLSTISEAERGGLNSPSRPSNRMMQKPGSFMGSGIQEPWLDRLIYTELPGSQPPARPSKTAAPHGLGLFGADDQSRL